MTKQTLAYLSFLLTAAAWAAALPAHAQSSEQKVKGYSPPPLFGAPPPAQPRPAGQLIVPPKVSTEAPPPAIYSNERAMPENKAAAPVYVKPRVSRSRDDKPIEIEPYIPKFPPLEPVPMEETPRGRGIIVDRPAAPAEAPLPAVKPDIAANDAAPAPAPTAQPPAPAAATPAVSAPPATTAAPAAEKPAMPNAIEAAMPVVKEAAPAQRVTSKGVVTGPKTMPTAPTTSVERETTYVPETPAATTLLERHVTNQVMDNNTAEAATLAAPPAPAFPAGFRPVALLAPGQNGKSLMSLDFTPGSAGLDERQTLTLAHQIVPALKAAPTARLLIQVYATPANKGQNSDRRIALSRALGIRSALMKQGIETRRIDVRAIGSDPNGPASDRAELVISAPRQTL